MNYLKKWRITITVCTIMIFCVIGIQCGKHQDCRLQKADDSKKTQSSKQVSSPIVSFSPLPPPCETTLRESVTGDGTSFEITDHGLQKAEIFTVTAYCGCFECCGKWSDGTFADGTPIGGKVVAADISIPFGTILNIPEYGKAIVRDRGGKIKGNKLDVYFKDHQTARNWGVKEMMIRLQTTDYRNKATKL